MGAIYIYIYLGFKYSYSHLYAFEDTLDNLINYSILNLLILYVLMGLLEYKCPTVLANYPIFFLLALNKLISSCSFSAN